MNTGNHCIGKLCPVCRYNKASRAYMTATTEWAKNFWAKVKQQLRDKYYLK
jgi:uncharacterized glyoxalase superfamily protein PhnB